jgi:hypothetical protein
MASIDQVDVRPWRQSGKSKKQHQPLGLIMPATTAQAAGGRNSAQAAQLKPFFGRSWYDASALDTFSRVGTGGPPRQTIGPDASARSRRRRDISATSVATPKFPVRPEKINNSLVCPLPCLRPISNRTRSFSLVRTARKSNSPVASILITQVCGESGAARINYLLARRRHACRRVGGGPARGTENGRSPERLQRAFMAELACWAEDLISFTSDTTASRRCGSVPQCRRMDMWCQLPRRLRWM